LLTPALLSSPLRSAITATTRTPEPDLLPALLEQARLSPTEDQAAHDLALRIARGDQTPLPGFDENDYVPAAKFGARDLGDLATEFEHVRKANLFLFRGMDDAAWLRKGTANGAAASVRALAYIIAGHERHHMAIVRERYLG
jgi:hypothetical protein